MGGGPGWHMNMHQLVRWHKDAHHFTDLIHQHTPIGLTTGELKES